MYVEDGGAQQRPANAEATQHEPQKKHVGDVQQDVVRVKANGLEATRDIPARMWCEPAGNTGAATWNGAR